LFLSLFHSFSPLSLSSSLFVFFSFLLYCFHFCASHSPFPFPLPIEGARCHCILSYFPRVSDEIEGHWKTNDSRCLHCVRQTRRDPRAITSPKSYYVSLFNPSSLAELSCLVLHVTINLLQAYSSGWFVQLNTPICDYGAYVNTKLRRPVSDREPTALQVQSLLTYFDLFVTENGYTWTHITSKSTNTYIMPGL
jgi:hypothetical protein